ncbi:MAG: lamin tail domain-containing protein, partial [bacterium]
MNRVFRHIGWGVVFTGMLCLGACLDPTANSFDKTGSSHKTVVINEIVARASDGDDDWIELYNAGEHAAYLRDYALVDDNVEREPVLLPDIILEPGEFIMILATEEEPEDGSPYVPFRLGSDDMLILYWGLSILDVLNWEAGEAPAGYSYGRFPDGVGAATTLIPTPNVSNREIFLSALVVNEIVARPLDEGSDWIELYNAADSPVYMGDYSIVDDNVLHDPVVLPDMVLEPGEFFVILASDVPPGDGSFYVPFRLGVDDCVTLYQDGDIMNVL